MAISEQQATSPFAGRRMTLDEFLRLPEEDGTLEYDNGVVTQKVAPQADHSSISGVFYDAFNAVGRTRKLGRAFQELRFKAGSWAPVPDVSYYSRQRLRPDSPHRYGNFADVPDIAIEVVSPGQSVTKLVTKCLRYISVGVLVSVLVDPDEETVFIFRPGQPTQSLHGDDRIDLDDILPDFELTVRGLFDAVVEDWAFVPPPSDRT